MEEIAIETATINLDQFLKWGGIIESGGQVKLMVEEKKIKINGIIVSERRKKLKPGDIVEIKDMGIWTVAMSG